MAHELIIGTYTERLLHVTGRAEGILSCRYDGGVVGKPRGLAVTNNPSYLALSGDRQYLYAVNEVTTFADEAGAIAYAGVPARGLKARDVVGAVTKPDRSQVVSRTFVSLLRENGHISDGCGFRRREPARFLPGAGSKERPGRGRATGARASGPPVPGLQLLKGAATSSKKRSITSRRAAPVPRFQSGSMNSSTPTCS